MPCGYKVSSSDRHGSVGGQATGDWYSPCNMAREAAPLSNIPILTADLGKIKMLVRIVDAIRDGARRRGENETWSNLPLGGQLK